MEALQLYTGCPAISTHYQSLQFNHPLEESPSSENGRAALTENQSLMVTRLVITTRGGGGGRVEQAAAAAAGHYNMLERRSPRYWLVLTNTINCSVRPGEKTLNLSVQLHLKSEHQPIITDLLPPFYGAQLSQTWK